MNRPTSSEITWTLLAIGFASGTPPIHAGIETEPSGINLARGLFGGLATLGAKQLVGDAGISSIGGLESGQDGILYAIGASLIEARGRSTINQAEAIASFIATLTGSNAYPEGSLAIAPAGLADITNMDTDLSKKVLGRLRWRDGGAVARIGTLGVGPDVNGLAWRGDGMLVGLNATSNRLFVIDPATAVISALATLPFAIGDIGGVAALGATRYLATAARASLGPIRCIRPACSRIRQSSSRA